MLPGSYTVALLVDGKEVDRKPLEIVMDPEVRLTGEARVAYNRLLTELHELQRRATEEAASPLAALHAEVQKAAPKVDSSAAPAEVKAEFAEFRKAFDAVRVKFGVPVLGGGGGFGGGGFGGGAAVNQQNVLGRLGQAKNSIGSVWETPSAALLAQADAVKAAVPPAIEEARAVLARARTVSQALARHGVTLLAPPE